MKILFFFPLYFTTAGIKNVNLSCDILFMFNNCHRQAGVLQHFLVTFGKFCSITEKWPLGIKNNEL